MSEVEQVIRELYNDVRSTVEQRYAAGQRSAVVVCCDDDGNPSIKLITRQDVDTRRSQGILVPDAVADGIEQCTGRSFWIFIIGPSGLPARGYFANAG